MDPKILMKEVYEKAKIGQFAEVIQLIKGVKIKKEVGLNILVCASNACYNNSKDSSKIDKDEVYSLLNNIICCIDTIDHCHLVPYLQSIFHIIKYMCDKEWFEDLTKMEFIIIPTFLKDFSLETIKESKHVYQTLITKLCNSIFRLSEGKKTNYNKYLLNIIKIILKANCQINGFKETLSLAHKFLNSLENLDFQRDQLCKFYLIVLDVLARDSKKADNYTDGIQLLLHLFSIMLSNIIEAKEFHIAVTFLDDVETRTGLSFVQKEFVNSHVMFKAVSAIFPSSAKEMQTNMENCKVQIKAFKMGHKKICYNIIRLLEEPFYYLFSYYKSSGGKFWRELPTDTFFNILEFIREDICCHLVAASTKCSCGCSSEKNYCGTLKIGCQISGLLKYYLDSNKNISKKTYSGITQWQIYFYEILKKAKAHNCKKWIHIYKELGTYTYNIGTTLYRQESVAFVEVYQCFLKNSLEFEGSAPELLKPHLNEVTFNMICELSDKNRNIERCMAFAALYCLLYPQKSNAVFQNWWIKSKLKVKEDSSIQQLTLVSVLEKDGKILSSICNPQQYLNKENKLELLSYELLRYKAVWKSKESVMTAFSHLIEIAEEPKISKVILEIFSDGEIHLHENMSAVFSKVEKRFQNFLKNSSDCYIKMALAVLCYYNYKDSSKETADENLEEMERTMQVMESAKEKFEPIPKDPNDECDIISAYSNLRLSKFTEILKPLNKCVELIGSLKPQSFEPQIIKNISKLLTKVGLEYRLHCFSIKSLQAFEMSLKFGEMISDYVTRLTPISFLIENADIKKNFVKELIIKGDELAKLLEKHNLNDIHSKTLAIYQISKAKTYLYDDTDLSFEAWKVADGLVTTNEAKDEFKFLRAELHILRYKLTKSCNFVPGEHESHPMTLKLHCAMDIVISLSHKNILSTYELCILFDTVYELAKVYYLMRLPRDLRAYSKNSVLLTQKIVLPMRCVSFLILLAHSDLLTCKFDHCNVKLNGVNDIFCLSQSRPVFFNEKVDLIESDAKTVDNEIDKCANQIQELALDVPQHTRQYSPSSPLLVVESFKTPQFLSHEKSCMCFVCLSFEYHQLLLQKYHLDALFNMYDKDERVAEEFIKGALMLYKTLRRNYDNYRIRAKTLISESLIVNFDDSFREYYGNILYDYSSHLMRKSQKSLALKINTELVLLLKPKKVQYVYLYNDALLQRLSYVVSAPKRKSDQIEIDTKIKNVSLTPKENISIQKTPTSKKSTVTVTVNGIRKCSPPKRRLKKMCALFNSPSDTEDTLKKSPIEAEKAPTSKNKTSKKSESHDTFAFPKTKDKKKATSVLGTPLLGDTLTPKIQIFTDEGPTESIRKNRRKQPTSVKKQLSVDVQEANGSSKQISNTKNARVARNLTKTLNSAITLEKNNYSLIENCDVESSQNIPIIAGPSKTRGQLLTQKIKDSTLKENCNIESSQNMPVIAGPSKTRSQLLTQKIKDCTLKNKTPSAILRQELGGRLLADKITIPVSEKNISPNLLDSETSSVLSASPEHEVISAKSKVVLGKIRLSAKKTKESINKATKGKRIGAEPEVKKNLLNDFLDNDASGSKCTKHTGAIRKSTRNRVL